MKKIVMLTGIIFLLWGMIPQQNIFAEVQIEIKVAKHIVKGSGVTAAQMESWVAAMNTDWACSFKFVQVGDPDTVDNVGDGKVAGAINIYGSAYFTVAPGNPGRCVDENYIEIGQSCPPSSASHEFGHWMGATPDSTTTEHGTPVGKYPDYPGYTGYDTNGDGVQDDKDRENIMYPGVRRTGTKTDDLQQFHAKQVAIVWKDHNESVKTGRGAEGNDAATDGMCPFEEMTSYRFSGWGNCAETYVFFAYLLVSQLKTPDEPSFLGFYVESDNDTATGMPPDGLDYYVGYDLAQKAPVLKRYDSGWVPLDASGVGAEFANISYDAPFDPVPIGIKLSFNLSLLTRKSGDYISVRAAAEHGFNSTYYDYAPDTGYIQILTTPVPAPTDGWTCY